MAADRNINPSGQADEGGGDIEFIVDDLEREDLRAKAKEQALEEDEEDDHGSDDDDVPNAPVPDAWNRHGPGAIVVSDGHDSRWELRVECGAC